MDPLSQLKWGGKAGIILEFPLLSMDLFKDGLLHNPPADLFSKDALNTEESSPSFQLLTFDMTYAQR